MSSAQVASVAAAAATAALPYARTSHACFFSGAVATFCFPCSTSACRRTRERRGALPRATHDAARAFVARLPPCAGASLDAAQTHRPAPRRLGRHDRDGIHDHFCWRHVSCSTWQRRKGGSSTQAEQSALVEAVGGSSSSAIRLRRARARAGGIARRVWWSSIFHSWESARGDVLLFSNYVPLIVGTL